MKVADFIVDAAADQGRELPDERLEFSNRASSMFGQPSFNCASFEIGREGATQNFALRPSTPYEPQGEQSWVEANAVPTTFI